MVVFIVIIAITILVVYVQLGKRRALSVGDVFSVSIFVKISGLCVAGAMVFGAIYVMLYEFHRARFIGFTAIGVVACLFSAILFRTSLILREDGFLYRSTTSPKKFYYTEFSDVFVSKYSIILMRKDGRQLALPGYLENASSLYGHLKECVYNARNDVMENAKDVRS